MEHYLDNAATTKPCAEAAAAVMSCISAHYGNPSSLHRKGLEAQHEVEYARNQIAGALGCKAQEIVFTSGATESSNLAIRGAVAACFCESDSFLSGNAGLYGRYRAAGCGRRVSYRRFPAGNRQQCLSGEHDAGEQRKRLPAAGGKRIPHGEAE